MIKYLQRLKSRKGLTLVEVVIATAIFSLLLVAVFSMYDPIVRITDMVARDSEMQRVVSASERFIIQQLRNSAEVEIHHGVDALASVSGAMGTFRDRIGGGSTGNMPQALIIDTNGRLYNIRMVDGVDITAAISALNSHRVFNEMFYSDLSLRIAVGLERQHPCEQERYNTYLALRVDALRGTEINLSSRSSTYTMFSWIGSPTPQPCGSGCMNASGAGSCKQQETLRARFATPPLAAVAPETIPMATNEGGFIVILYHNSPLYGRVVVLCPFCETDPCPNATFNSGRNGCCPHPSHDNSSGPRHPCTQPGTCGVVA